MKRPLLNRWERIHLSTHNDLFADRLKLHLALVRFNREVYRALMPLIKWLSFRGKSDAFSYLYVWLWLIQLSGIVAVIIHILNR